MTQPEELGERGFGPRPLAVAVALTLFLLATSIYISLRLGGLPWPIIFSVIASAGIMRALAGMKQVSVHEINVAQAGGTIGGLMASAVAFTVPGILFLRDTMGVDIDMIDPYTLALVCVAGATLGVLLSIPLRRVYVDEEQLPYASGTAGAEVLKTQMAGGSGALLIAFTVLLAGIFALTRDLYFPLFTLSALASYGVVIYIFLMPLGVGIGYILGPRIAFNSWFGGAVVGSLAIVPFLVARDWAAGDATALVQNLGMGLVLGGGIGFFAAYVVPRIKRIFAPLFSQEGPWYMRLSPVVSLVAFVILALAGAPLLIAVVGVLGVWVMSTVAARMTGETDIDPLEQFGIIVGLASIGLYSLLGRDLGYLSAFVIVIFVSVATAVAGTSARTTSRPSSSARGRLTSSRSTSSAPSWQALRHPFCSTSCSPATPTCSSPPRCPRPRRSSWREASSGLHIPKRFMRGSASRLSMRSSPVSRSASFHSPPWPLASACSWA
jgi:hypothetical protein